ncbi:MAG: DUF4296 domain-containing protein [Bacteroidetes bacterium]|nr:DUF4296 domain-containing protein [Bacteroidota bacterium]
MRVLFIAFGIIVVGIVSCSERKSSFTPTIDMSKMSDIFYDISLAEGYVEAYVLKDSAKNRDSILGKEMEIVFKVHGIDANTFADNLKGYKQDPERFQVILDSANERANRGRNEIFLRRVPKPTKK